MSMQPDLLEGSSGDGLAARRAALRALEKILGQKKMLDTVLIEERYFADLPVRDRPLVRMMVSTVLRRKGQLDDLIARALDREAPRPETLKWILYLGIAQILFMDVANHAAVDTSVTLAGEAGLEGKKGFVNAILRRMTNEGNGWLDAQDAAALNVPAWLYRQWIASYGIVRAKDIANALLQQAPLDITAKQSVDQTQLAKDLSAKILPTNSLRREEGGLVEELTGFSSGYWWIQDAASALPVKLMGNLIGRTVLDMCAAPGGKTMQLADAGAKVIALDRNANRMKDLRANLARMGMESGVECVIEDGAVWNPRQTFTHILLDAPCTATGTARRHPDLLSLKSEKDQTALVATQERLLNNAARLLEAGGMLVYCTCSLQKAEGEDQVENFLKSHANFKRVPVRREEFGGMDGFVNSEGDVRVLPYLMKEEGGMDGFFISRLQKTS
ncbi:MAG TPA: RsmB/NOP family class I SAM-dependent RNA methyltransferase [Micavibrio sp.]|nr:RsmB/NOP family class I SAM-dependent RNA methyltransferase [Micavibrio sp.]